MEYTGYWMFICNPKQWAIDDFLDQKTEISTWKITSYQKDHIKIGDKAIIRVGKDKRTIKELNGKQRLESGIYAFVEIIGESEYKTDIKDDFWIEEGKSSEYAWRAKIRYVENLISSPIEIKNLKENSDFNENSPIIKGRQASSWPIDKKEYESLLTLSGKAIAELDEIKETELYSIDEIERIIKKYQNLTPRKKEIISTKIERGEISQVVKKIYNYECLICKALDQNPIGFTKKNGIPYIETHHFFPVSNLQSGSLGIGNLMTVCANHHRQLHYGNVEILKSNDKVFELNIDNKKLTVKKKQLTKPKLH
jgi:predicted HNH restriction endonuclease